MVQISEAAKRQLRVLVDERKLGPDRFLRLTVPPAWTGEGDFGIVVDARGGADTGVTLDGKTVLVVGPDVVEQIPNAMLDFKKTPDGPRFTLDVY
ncbi:MAG: hypothetical protein IIC32_02115 [Chloroflexi bacterium]|nr:hypothetical protein [Chloroflexota bacterium]